MVLVAYGWAQASPSPEDDTNYSTQNGKLEYLGSYIIGGGQTLAYAMIQGRASLNRLARQGKTTASFAMWMETVPEGFDDKKQFEAVLHSRSCEDDAGAVFQNPYECESDGGFTEGCDAATVAAHTGSTPLEFRLKGSFTSYVTSDGVRVYRVRFLALRFVVVVARRTHVRPHTSARCRGCRCLREGCIEAAHGVVGTFFFGVGGRLPARSSAPATRGLLTLHSFLHSFLFGV